MAFAPTNNLGMNPGFNLSTDSVASYDMIPSPHNKISSLHGPPKWHEDYRKLEKESEADNQGQLGGVQHNMSYNHFAYRPTVDSVTNTPAQQFVDQRHLGSGYPAGGSTYPPSYATSNAANSPHEHSNASPYGPSPYNTYVFPSNREASHAKPQHPQTHPPPLNTAAPPFQTNPIYPPPPSAPSRMRIENIVTRLLNPPPRNFGIDGMVTIDLSLVFRCLGPSHRGHIEYSKNLNRMVLRSDSELRVRGVELGLPGEYVAWLCGEEGYRGKALRIEAGRLREGKKGREEKSSF